MLIASPQINRTTSRACFAGAKSFRAADLSERGTLPNADPSCAIRAPKAQPKGRSREKSE